MATELLKHVKDEMIEHAKALNPVESCGYLAGKDGCITVLYKMTNIDNSPEHFSFDPKEQFAVVKQARNDGLQLMGVYHSHPESPARLSAEDLRLLNDPNMVYIIVSLMNNEPTLKAFKIKKESEAEINVEALDIHIKS